jgi:hypothetical protein
MKKWIIILCFISAIAKGQDSVIRYHYWMKTRFDSIHAVDSFPLKAYGGGLFDFMQQQIKDSSWIMPISNVHNTVFQSIIQSVEGSNYLMDSIIIGTISDTMYINEPGPIPK